MGTEGLIEAVSRFTRHPQFRLGTLLSGVGVIAAYLGLLRYAGRGTMLPLFLLSLALLGWPASDSRRRGFVVCVAVNQFAVFMVVGCSTATWYTLGEGDALDCHIYLFPFYMAATILCMCRKYALSAILALTTAGACTLCFAQTQVVLVTRLMEIEEEVEDARQYVERVRRQHGRYPVNLDGYCFTRPGLARYVRYSSNWRSLPPGVTWPKCWPQWYRIEYKVDEGESHWYDSRTGWGYYPD